MSFYTRHATETIHGLVSAVEIGQHGFRVWISWLANPWDLLSRKTDRNLCAYLLMRSECLFEYF